MYDMVFTSIFTASNQPKTVKCFFLIFLFINLPFGKFLENIFWYCWTPLGIGKWPPRFSQSEYESSIESCRGKIKMFSFASRGPLQNAFLISFELVRVTFWILEETWDQSRMLGELVWLFWFLQPTMKWLSSSSFKGLFHMLTSEIWPEMAFM